MELYIVKQESMFKETKANRGKVLHHVVKNTAFQIRYGMDQVPTGKTFKNARVTCRLLYDLKSRKEVDFITSVPLEYVVMPDDDGKECVIEFRVKVLTTQLEGSHFLVLTSVTFDGVVTAEVDSEPIKAVSKPAQIRRLIEQKEGKKSKKMIAQPVKRNRTGDTVLDTVLDMQRIQDEHTIMLNSLQNLIAQRQMYSYYPYGYSDPSYAQYPVEAKPISPNNAPLLSEDSTQPKSASSTPLSVSQSNYIVKNDDAIKQEDPEELFKEKMKEMVSLYAQLNPGNRKNKLRKIMSTLAETSPEDISDFRNAIVDDHATTVLPGFDSFPTQHLVTDDFFDYTNNTFSDPFVQNELNAFCLDYLQNGHTSLEY